MTGKSGRVKNTVQVCEALVTFHSKYARPGGHEITVWKKKLERMKEAVRIQE